MIKEVVKKEKGETENAKTCGILQSTYLNIRMQMGKEATAGGETVKRKQIQGAKHLNFPILVPTVIQEKVNNIVLKMEIQF
jgi:hypothetical protein